MQGQVDDVAGGDELTAAIGAGRQRLDEERLTVGAVLAGRVQVAVDQHVMGAARLHGDECVGQAGRGGAAPIRAAGGGQMARPTGLAGDGGQALVELIQNVIAPSTWDVNGGSGSIRYWRPGHALVVRQTEQVHEDVGSLLRQLERVNR